MGFGDGDIRASHTIRIFGTNRDGELLRDIWLDIERMDVYRVTTQIDGHFQGQYRRLYWLDDPDGSDYNENGNPARTEGLKKFCSPDEEDQEDPAEWIPVRTIIEMSFNESTDSNERSGRRGNRTSADNQTRSVAARRCFHRDTSIDDAADAAADQGRKAYVVASDRYDFVEGSEDRDDYIEVQYVSWTLEQSSAKEDEGKNQMVQTNWKNIHYLNFTDEAQGPVNPDHGFDPPWSLDPYQAVVNCQFAAAQKAVAGLFRINHGDEWTLVSDDGEAWLDGYGAGTASVATGLGYTVIGRNDRLLTFGKPRDGSPCFIATRAAIGAVIERGVLDEDGDLQWTVVATLPGGAPARSCCLAGDAFFISYQPSDADAALLAVSFDGENFSFGINPFPGVVAASNPDGFLTSPDPGAFSSNVAYNKKTGRYVTTGGFQMTHDAFVGSTNVGYVDENLMSSTSNDGVNWTPYFDVSRGGGSNSWNPVTGIGMRAAQPSCVCFGKGVFVSAASYKNVFTSTSSSGTENNVGQACGIATSANGTGWVCQRLPNSLSTDANAGKIDGGDTQAVAFVKTQGSTAEGYPEGFFVALGTEFINLFPAPGLRRETKIWFSEDGQRWQFVRTETSNVSGWILSAINKRDGKLVDK